MEKLYLGIDIGGTKCAVIVGTENVKILNRISFETGKETEPKIIVNKIIEISEKLIKENTGDNRIFEAIGISCGGPLDSKKGIILSPPNLPLWDKVEIIKILENKFQIPAYIQNDANACAIAEWKFGAGQEKENIIFLTFGTGLGAGIILNGKLYSGTNDMAGEVGHIRLTETGPEGYGKKGSFEGYCSGGGIKDLAQIIIREKINNGEKLNLYPDETEISNISAKIVFENAVKGDKVSQEIVDICAKNLGKGLAVLIDILNPEAIILGSIFTRCEAILRPTMQAYINKEALDLSRSVCDILPAKLGEEIGDIGSLTVAICGADSRREI